MAIGRSATQAASPLFQTYRYFHNTQREMTFTAAPEKEADRTTKKRRRTTSLVVWPTRNANNNAKNDESPESPYHDTTPLPETGFVVGWKVSRSPPELSVQGWSVDTSIVAGVIAVSVASSGNRHLLDKEYNALLSRIQTWKNARCACACPEASTNGTTAAAAAADAVDNHTRTTCAACTSHLCMDGLTVLAFVSSNGERMDSVPDSLPRMNPAESLAGYPWWSNARNNNTETLEEQQLVLYENDTTILYSHAQAPNHSFFSAVLLTRLTHASTVMASLTAQDQDSLTQSATLPQPSDVLLDTSITHHPDTSDDDTTTTTPTTDERSNTDAWHTRLVTALRTRSLFWRHCETVTWSRLPLGRLPRPLLSRVHNNNNKNKNTDRLPTCSSICPNCQKRRLLAEPLHVSTAKSIDKFNGMVVSGLDAAMGVLWGMLLAFWLSRESTVQAVARMVSIHYALLRQSIAWLESFPIGFKLNEKLTENIGREMRGMLEVHEWFLNKLAVASSGYLPLVAAVVFLLTGAIFGGSGLAALLFDVSRVASLHTYIFAACFRKIYRSEVYLLAALWRLFRGKKRNILRHRTDSMNYDSMQLLLGTILFATALFLFTTVLVYHAFFAALNLAVSLLVSIAFLVPYLLIRFVPWGRFILRNQRPGWFTSRVYIENETKISSTYETGVDMTWLMPVSQTYGSIVMDTITTPLKALLSSYAAHLTEFLTGISSNELLVEALASATFAKDDKRS